MHRLIHTIAKSTGLPEKNFEQLIPLLRKSTLRKKELFVREGQIPRKIGFVEKGVFRYYYADEKGNEFTKGFFTENALLVSYTAMVNESPSFFSIEALEDAVITEFEYEPWFQIFKNDLSWHKFLIASIQHGYMKKEKREREFLLFDAEKRYRIFREEYSGLENRIKQHYIASYLGISEVALSRIRKKMGLVNPG
jgi:CRP-like cAMP-binding protein